MTPRISSILITIIFSLAPTLSLSLSAYVYKYPIPSLPSDEKKKKHLTRAFKKLVALLAWSQSHRKAERE